MKSLIVRIFSYLEQQSRRAKRKREEAERERRINERMMAKWTRKVGIFTIVLAAITAMGAIIAATQVWAFIQSERSSVSITNMNPVPTPLTANVQIVLRMALQNSGKSDAIVDGGNISTKADYGNLPTIPPYAKSMSSFRTIIPANTTFSSNARLPATFAPETVNSISSGKGKWWVFGWLQYRDDYSWLTGEHTTGFCFIYDPLNDPTKEAMFDSCGTDAVNYIFRR